MNFVEAVTTCFKKYVVFDGRASRAEFWFFYLFLALLIFVVSMLCFFLSETLGNILLAVAVLAIFLPTLTVHVRRLHDIDKSGKWVLLALIPGLGGLALMIMALFKGTEGPNRFGLLPGPAGQEKLP